MCGKGSNSPSGGYAAGLPVAQQNFTQASPEAMGWYRNAMDRAQQAASQPYQRFGTQASDFVAQLNAQQQGAQQGLQGIAGGYQPYSAQAGQMMAGAGQANAAQLAANQYMNPYMSQVVDPVRNALQQQQGQQLSQQQAEAIKSGAFGGERAGLQRQLLRGQQELAMGSALSPLYSQGYGQALGAAQTDLQRQLAAGQQLGAQGLQAQQASLGAGTLGQQTQQAGITALQNQFNTAQMFPYMQAQFLSGVAGGLGPLMGQTSTQTQASNPFGMFLARGGVAEEDGTRMGGAVTEGGDYARGGYIRGGVSYGGDDIGSILSSQERMYDDSLKADTTMPTGEVRAAEGLKPAEFAAQPARKTALDAASQLAGLAKTGIGIAGGLKSLFSSGDKSSAISPTTGVNPADGMAGWENPSAASEETTGSDILGSLGKLGLAAAANYFLPGSGALAGFFADGGEVRPHAQNGLAVPAGNTVPDDSQLGYVARTMLREDPSNMEAIGHVIRNRLQSGRWGDTPQSVVTAPKQFTPWNQEMRGTKADPRLISETDPRYQKALGAARNVFGGQSEDPTGGALNFYNPKLASPKWGSGMSNAIKIGEHIYGTAAGGDRGLGKMPPNARDYYALDKSSAPAGGVAPPAAAAPAADDGIFTKENVLPALAGLAGGIGGMLGSKSRYLGTALAQGAAEGIGTGAKAAIEMPKALAETENIRQQALERAALTKRQEAETKAVLAGLYEKVVVPGTGVLIFDKSNPYGGYTKIMESDGKPIPGQEHIAETVISEDPNVVKKLTQEDVSRATGKEAPHPWEWQSTTVPPASFQPKEQVNISLDPASKERAATLGAEVVSKAQSTGADASRQLMRIAEMEHAVQNLENPKGGWLTKQGPWAEQRKDLAKKINFLSSTLTGRESIPPSEIASGEILDKDAFRLGSAAASGFEGHPAKAIIEQSVIATPGMGNTKMGYQRLLAGLKMAAQYEQDRAKFINNYYTKFRNTFEAQELFDKLNPPSRYAQAAIASTIHPSHMEALKKYGMNIKDQIDKIYGAGTAQALMER